MSTPEKPHRRSRPDQAQEPNKHILFAKRVNKYPEAAQEDVTSLSDMLLEPDVAARVRESVVEIRGIIGQLSSHGLNDGEVNAVLDYFNLPKPENKK